MRTGVALLAAIVLSGAAAAGARAADAPPAAALQGTIDTCATCHGSHGQSVSPAFPNLAAQTAPYIEAQLRAFRAHSRSEPEAQAFMWGIAAQLDDARIGALAAWFAMQPAAPGHAGDVASIAAGRRLFATGAPAGGIAPCSACHGAKGEGLAGAPRLAGQHAPYLLKQLLVIQGALREAPVMHGLIRDLTRDQMQALVAYLESL